MKMNTRLLIYREKQRFGPVFSWSVLSKRRFLKHFSSSFSFSLWHPYPSLNKLRKTIIKVVKTCLFALNGSRRCSKKHIWGQSGTHGWGIVSFCMPGGGEWTSKKEKNCNPQGCAPGGGGRTYLQVKLNHALLKEKNTSMELLLPSKYQLLNFLEMT